MNTEEHELLMSQFADGELGSDEANDLLLEVLDVPGEREKLKDLLRLRQATFEWRSRQPSRPVLVMSGNGHRKRPPGGLGRMALAACLGGVLVLAGIYSAGQFAAPAAPVARDVSRPTEPVTADKMLQVARVFALHESVAGPLAWYASDDKNVHFAEAVGSQAARQPIAVLLRLESGGPAEPRSVMIICREDSSAMVELPGTLPGEGPLRVYISPRSVNGKVDMEYSIAADGDEQRSTVASLRGQRRVGLAETSLGQLAMGDRVLNVDAAAWLVRQEQN